MKDKKSGEDFEVRGGTVGSARDKLAAGFCQRKKENRCCGNARVGVLAQEPGAGGRIHARVSVLRIEREHREIIHDKTDASRHRRTKTCGPVALADQGDRLICVPL